MIRRQILKAYLRHRYVIRGLHHQGLLLRSDGDIVILRLLRSLREPIELTRINRLSRNLRDVRIGRGTVFIRSKAPTIR
jgi:hypothetical protein